MPVYEIKMKYHLNLFSLCRFIHLSLYFYHIYIYIYIYICVCVCVCVCVCMCVCLCAFTHVCMSIYKYLRM